MDKKKILHLATIVGVTIVALGLEFKYEPVSKFLDNCREKNRPVVRISSGDEKGSISYSLFDRNGDGIIEGDVYRAHKHLGRILDDYELHKKVVKESGD